MAQQSSNHHRSWTRSRHCQNHIYTHALHFFSFLPTFILSPTIADRSEKHVRLLPWAYLLHKHALPLGGLTSAAMRLVHIHSSKLFFSFTCP